MMILRRFNFMEVVEFVDVVVEVDVGTGCDDVAGDVVVIWTSVGLERVCFQRMNSSLMTMNKGRKRRKTMAAALALYSVRVNINFFSMMIIIMR